MGNYSTKQRKILLDYLENRADESLSVREIASALESQGISISAVYRNLALLEEEDKIRKSVKNGSREAYYQYISSECKNHLHLSCCKCGKTFHAENAETQRLVNELAEKEDFTFDGSECVLYGICGKCRKKVKANENI